MNRESIYSAIFALAPSAFTTRSRLLKHWDAVSASAMPALFQAQMDEDIKATPGRPPTVHGGCTWWLYVTAQPGNLPSSLMNPLVDACFAALEPPVGSSSQTLGGLVDQCYIDGKIQTDEGTLGNIAVVRLPIIFIAGGY